jgi:hypothetical protein
MLMRIFGLKREEKARGWRRLRNEEQHNLNASPSIIRLMKSRGISWAMHVGRMGVKRNACSILVRKLEGERPLRKRRHRGSVILK